MLTRCRKCGLENNYGRLFCKRCLSRLNPTCYDLIVEDFVTDGDQEALELLKAAGPLLQLTYSTIIEPRLRNLAARLSKGTMKSKLDRRIESLIVECADILALDLLPAVYLSNAGQRNAFTAGSDLEPIIVIDQDLVGLLSDEELRALLGHEVGHIKSRHLAYHSIAELLERGLGFSTSILGMGLVSIPMRLAMLAWHRESEFSADRAGLIAADSFASVASMFVKMIGDSGMTMDLHTNLTSLLEALQSHPHHLTRLKALKEFTDSAKYLDVKKKLEYREMFKLAFSETCRFCGASKNVEEIFCPRCKRSLA